ncbi:hypothetical protein LINGRAHAP2_LOCUS8124 [Linum grandiflorum]
MVGSFRSPPLRLLQLEVSFATKLVVLSMLLKRT